MSEDRETALRRMTMRSMRRGTKEMDIILSGFAARALAELDPETLALYDQLLEENDQDLYLWVSGQATAPERFSGLIARIAETSRG